MFASTRQPCEMLEKCTYYQSLSYNSLHIYFCRKELHRILTKLLHYLHGHCYFHVPQIHYTIIPCRCFFPHATVSIPRKIKYSQLFLETLDLKRSKVLGTKRKQGARGRLESQRESRKQLGRVPHPIDPYVLHIVKGGGDCLPPNLVNLQIGPWTLHRLCLFQHGAGTGQVFPQQVYKKQTNKASFQICTIHRSAFVEHKKFQNYTY